MVDVSTGSISGSVDVLGGSTSSSVDVKSDTTQYWSNQSKSWAEKSEASAKKSEQAKDEVIAQKDVVIGEVTAEGEKQKGILETTGQPYVDEAKNWANKLGDTVDGVEYSAKHYAELTADRAETAITDIDTAKTNSLNEITTLKSEVLTDIQETGIDTRLDTNVSNVTNIGINKINSLTKPDTTKVIEKIFDTEYVAEMDGWLFYYVGLLANAENNTSSIDVAVIVDTIEVFHLKCQIGTGSGFTTLVQQEVGHNRIFKGQKYIMKQVFQMNNASIIQNKLIFLPLKGAN